MTQYELFKRNGKGGPQTGNDVLSLVAHGLQEVILNQRLLKENLDVKYGNILQRLDSQFAAQVRDPIFTEEKVKNSHAIFK